MANANDSMDVDEAASLLDGLGRGSDNQAAQLVQRSTVQICCAREGCKRFKGSYCPVDSSNIVSWNTHGHPNDTARHSTIDGLCEFVWHRQYSHLDLAQFLALDMTPQGRKDIDHYVAELIKIRQEKGPNCRIGKAEWAKVPIPTKLTKETFSQLAIEEPDDIFYTPEDYLKAFSMTPQQGGNACEWVESSKGKAYGCWVAQDAPMKRKRSAGQRINHSELLDRSDDALSEDQLAKRFAAERAALFDSPHKGASMPMPMKSPLKSPASKGGSQQQQPSLSPAPLAAGSPAAAVGPQHGGSATASSSCGLAPTHQTGCMQLGLPTAPTPNLGEAGPATGSGRKATRTAGGKAKAKGKAAAVPASSSQRLAILNEYTNLRAKFSVLAVEVELEKWLSDSNKFLKRMEKTKEAILSTCIVDADLLQFQLDLEDAYGQMNSLLNLVTTYKNYMATKKKAGTQPNTKVGAVGGGGGDTSAAFKKALDESAEISTPPVLRKAEYSVRLDMLRSALDLHSTFALMADARFKDVHTVEIEREAIENVVTDFLREIMVAEAKVPVQQFKVDETHKSLKSCISKIRGANLNEELRIQAADIDIVLHHSDFTLEQVGQSAASRKYFKSSGEWV